MDIRTIIVGPIETNCYLIKDFDEAILIDPGEEPERILKELGKSGGGVKLEKIILTHLHFDHIIAAREIKARTGAKIYCSKADLEILDENLLQKNEIDGFLGRDAMPCVSTFQVIETPGHTPGSICLYDKQNEILFSGDTIFAGSIGVTHFLGGNFGKIKDSIENKLLTLPEETKVFPGHGRSFILREEKENIKKLIS